MRYHYVLLMCFLGCLPAVRWAGSCMLWSGLVWSGLVGGLPEGLEKAGVQDDN